MMIPSLSTIVALDEIVSNSWVSSSTMGYPSANEFSLSVVNDLMSST